MLIGKNWKLEADNLNVILSRLKSRKTKDGIAYKAWEVVGYYSTVANALKDLVNYGVRETELKDLETIKGKQDELYKLIESIKGKGIH